MRPHCQTDMQKLENIQWKTTRMVNSLKHAERLKALHLPALQYRRGGIAVI